MEGGISMKFLILLLFLYFFNISTFSNNNQNQLVRVTINNGSKYLVCYINFSTFEVPNNLKIINEKF